MVRRKTTTSEDERIEEIKAELIDTMLHVGIDPVPYSIAIKITAETLREREKAYKEYMENGGSQVTEKGHSNPNAVRLASWNSQARACLSMLKLTPWRVIESPTE